MKPWHTVAWKKRREELLKGKSCEWCGSKENLVVHHPKHFHGLREYKKCITRIMHDYFSKGKNQKGKKKLLAKARMNVTEVYSYTCPKCSSKVYARKTLRPKYRCTKCKTETDKPIKKLSAYSRNQIRRQLRFLFSQQHKEEIDNLFAQQKKNADREYLSFKNVMVLCKKCHYAKEKRLVLCEICKNHYHKPNYGKCWECFTKTEGGRKFTEMIKLIPYIHPWCGHTFQIQRKWWDIEANPQSCCIEHCETDCNSCEIAEKHWG